MPRHRDGPAFVLLALIWGLGFSAAEIGLSTFPPVLFMAFRYDIGGILLIGYVVATYDNWQPATRGDLFSIVSGGVLWIAVGNGIWFIGQKLTTSVFSGMMAALVPLATTAFSWVLLPDDRLTPLSLLGLLVGFVGAVIIMVPSDTVGFTAGVLGKGLLLAGVCGAALGSVLIRRSAPSIPTTVQTAWSVVLGAILLHLLSPLIGETWSGTVTFASGAALGYIGVFSTLAYLLYFSLLERHTAIELMLVTYMIPIVAAGAGWLLFGEAISPSMILGFPIVLVGFGLMKREKIRDEVSRWRTSS